MIIKRRELTILDKFEHVGVKELPEEATIPTMVKKHPKFKTREERANYILSEHDRLWNAKEYAVIVNVGDNTWRVMSFTRKESSKVWYEDDKWKCDCPDKKFRDECKHIMAIQIGQEKGIHFPTQNEALSVLYDIES